MAPKKKSRRRSGHPATEARRREQEQLRREARSNPSRQIVLTLCRDAATLRSALEAELWASEILGSWWPPSLEFRASRLEADDEYGGPLVAELARNGSEGALAALIAFGEVCETELALVARRHAEEMIAKGVRPPAWAEAITTAQINRVAVMRDQIFDDGMTIFIEAEHNDGGESHAIGVYIDNNLGGMAKDIVQADSIEHVEQIVAGNSDDQDAVIVESMGPVEAGARIYDAMQLTDETLDPPVGEEYPALRALALLRNSDLPGGPPVDVSTSEVSPERREALRAEFLSAPEGKQFDAESDEAFIASLAIDFCADYVDGRPLRWSPSLVEIFMLGWLPNKVLADRATFEAVPEALAAWVRFAGRRREIAEWAIDKTIAAIEEFKAELLLLQDGEGELSPSMEFLTAAKSAGIDLEDEQAMESFIAGWNARSGIDA
ncbi:MAG: hypothetical protein WAO61_06850 [Solirubrobacterales bacterium]